MNHRNFSIRDLLFDSRHSLPLAAVLAALFPLCGQAAAKPSSPPNVLMIYIDDMGSIQPSCYGGKLVETPNIDRLAANGVRFTDGYVSACICTPSRVGLLTGRYQARTGHDANTEGPLDSVAIKNLVLSETLFPQRMKAAGYRTGMVGKWHVGCSSPEFLPISRGFDEAFGTTGNLAENPRGIGWWFSGLEKISDPEAVPITTPLLTQKAVDFIGRNREQPWFLYLAYHAVHSPIAASPDVIDQVKDVPKNLQKYAAMICELDDAIRQVMAKLQELGLAENTLVFCLSDNGGANPHAEAGAFRGRKWLMYEGGIRVPWIVQWPARIPGGRVLPDPVIQLDILPTALAAAGVTPEPEWQLDGVNLLPLLEGEIDQLEPRNLYWRFGTQYAIRKGDWKLVKAGLEEPVMLVDLKTDPGEQQDLTAQHPEKASELQGLWDRWNATMQPPRWEDKRWNANTPKHKEKNKVKGNH